MAVVIFDMDDVLYHYDFGLRLRRIAALSGLDETDILKCWIDSGWEDRADAGAFATGDAYLAAFNTLLGTTITTSAWVEARTAAMTANDDMLAVAQDLARRHKVAVLTNNGPLLAAHIDVIAPRLRAIFNDAIFTSAGLGAAKPSPEVFRRIMAQLGAKAAETYFIDDMAEYVAGATACGITAIHYTAEMDVRKQLAVLL